MRLAILGLAVLGCATPSFAAVLYNNETNSASELNYVVLQFPGSLTATRGQSTATIYGQVYHPGVTDPAGASASILASVGYGPNGSDPITSNASWTWTSASFNTQVSNNDEYRASILAPLANGTYAYTYRFSIDGITWTLADKDGAGSGTNLTYSPSQLGVMTVVPEPASTAAVAGLGALAVARRRR